MPLSATVFFGLTACSDVLSPSDPGADAAQKGGTTTPTPPPATGVTINPLAGAQLFVDPNSQAKRQADEWRSSRPADAAELDKIAKQPMAAWFGSWFSDVGGAANELVTRAGAAGVVPVLVLYNIPQRDCGSYSAGGASGADAYKAWIDAIGAGVGYRKAVIILEP
ncbi:MAG: glycoside hydrolase family 6 protein, partial [Gemmatimonadota bacterium]